MSLRPAPVPLVGDGGESRGTSPSGAVRAGPPAAQAEQMERLSVHDFASVPPSRPQAMEGSPEG